VAKAANAGKAQKAKEEQVACLEQLATNRARTARYTSKHGPSTSRVQKYRRDRSPETVRMERKKDTAAHAKACAVQKSKSRKNLKLTCMSSHCQGPSPTGLHFFFLGGKTKQSQLPHAFNTQGQILGALLS
jgi:hypothetical protein